MYILAIDQGTTSTRAIVFDKLGTVISQNSRGHEQIYPNPGWVSHNAKEIYFNVIEASRRAMEAACINPKDVQAIGITNQRETLVAWDKESGEPVCDAIVWQCKRTAELCSQIKLEGFDKTIRTKTGLIVDPYFSATKIKWVLDNIPAAAGLMNSGRLLVGTMDSYIIWRLTEGRQHVTDYTNASRTMLFNINTLEWDKELLDYFGINRNILPKVVSSSGIIDCTSVHELGAAIPISGIAGDQHAALFGQLCFNEGDAKNTYGTGCFILKNIGNKPVITDSKLLTTIAWHINGSAAYAQEGSVFSAGSAIEWLINDLRLVADVVEINDICRNTTDCGGVYMVPAFTGLGAPYWDMYARGTITGMSLGTTRNHIVRAVVESIAYQTKDVLDYIDKDASCCVSGLRVDGGVSKSDFAMQFQADILGIPVIRQKRVETTALGAAYLAGLGVGMYKDLDEISKNSQLDKTYLPNMTVQKRNMLYNGWSKAVSHAMNWVDA